MNKNINFLKVVFLGYALLLSSCLFSQAPLTICIQDSITKEPLRFAAAYFKKNNHIGFVSNLNGQFIIDLKSTKFFNQRDTLVCSYIGYEEQLFPINLEKPQEKGLTIRMLPKAVSR